MTSLRLATYNVYACIGTDGRYDPARVAAVIDELDADVIALQECTFSGDGIVADDAGPPLSAIDGYVCAFGPTRERRGLRFGNVVLSRHPMRDVHRVDLSRQRGEPRGALTVTVENGAGELHVVATHLGLWLRERRFQVRQLLDHIDAREGRPLAVLGDFNDWLPGRSVAHELDRRLGRARRVRSFPACLPLLPLDRVWVGPGAALRDVTAHRSRLARVASDHLPVVATIAIP